MANSVRYQAYRLVTIILEALLPRLRADEQGFPAGVDGVFGACMLESRSPYWNADAP